MARVIVVGGGLGGLAAAARLAKLGHRVSLLERSPILGGALGRVDRDGFTWDAGPAGTLVPAVLRDLFRKSGQTLEAELGLDLEPLPVLREHRFPDGSAISLPAGRGGQLRAWDALAPGLGRSWVDFVAEYADDWAVIRRRYAEVPWDRSRRRTPENRALLARLDSRETLRRRVAGRLPDPRQRAVAEHALVADGHDPRQVPAWCGLVAYLEQRFGCWRLPGGMWQLADALRARLVTRRVDIRTECEVEDVVVRGGRAVGVRTPEGELAADVVVCAVDPRRLPALAAHVTRTEPAHPPTVTHLGIRGDLPDLAHETVLHGDPVLVLRTGGLAPEDGHAVTLLARGARRDPLTLLAERGLDLRDRVVVRLDREPDEIAVGGSPYGVRWRGRRTVRRRLGPDTPIAGVLAAGAHATPGAGLPFVGLSAALVAQRVGRA